MPYHTIYHNIFWQWHDPSFSWDFSFLHPWLSLTLNPSSPPSFIPNKRVQVKGMNWCMRTWILRNRHQGSPNKWHMTLILRMERNRNQSLDQNPKSLTGIIITRVNSNSLLLVLLPTLLNMPRLRFQVEPNFSPLPSFDITVFNISFQVLPWRVSWRVSDAWLVVHSFSFCSSFACLWIICTTALLSLHPLTCSPL